MTSPRGEQGYRPGYGWIGFAGAVMGVVGISNIVSGILAISEDEVFLAGGRRASLVLDLTGWGWVHLILGVLLVAVAIALFRRAAWADYAAIVIILVNMVSQVMFIPFYPFWAILIIGLELVILWAIFTKGEERDHS